MAIATTRSVETINKWKSSVPKGRCLNDGKTHFKKGHVPWNKGKSSSDETKAKISKASKENNPRYWEGKKRSPETIKKISDANKGRVPWNKGLKMPNMSGVNHHNWKGGKTSESRIAKSTLEYKEWRESVFKRDDYTCQCCADKGCFIHPHHLLNFSEHKDKRFDIENGITLCKDCHREFHLKNGTRYNTVNQINEFIHLFNGGVLSQ